MIMPGRFSFPHPTISRSASRQARRRSHATVEQLERRELLSAAIAGVVLPTTDTTPLVHGHHHKPKPQAVRLYSDVNGNGVLDAGDKLKATKMVKGGHGSFIFKHVKFGKYMLAAQVGTNPLESYAVNVN